MKDKSKIKQELLKENAFLKKKIHELEHSESECKHAELKLKESEENMRYIVKHDPNAIAVYDRNLQYIAVSDRYLRDYNVKEADIIGKHHYEVFPEMPQRWKDVHARCLTGAIERNDDDYFKRPDGSITYNRWECRPWYKSDGGIGGMITYTEVTTERKNAELALRESESKFRALAENSCDYIMRYDRNHRHTYANPAAIQVSGKKADEFIGKTHREMGFSEELCDLWERSIDKVFVTGMPNGKIFEFAGAEGSVVLDWRLFPELDSDGRISSVLGVSRDITEQKRAEEALRESEEKYRLVVENAAEIILVAQDGLLKYVNPMAVKILGYPAEALTSMPFVELIHPEDINKVFEAHMRIMRREEHHPVHQFRVIPLDGTVRWVDSRAVVISWEGKPATVNFITDITERKRMEEEILALSITDQLTGLHNRRGFLSLAEQQLKLSDRNKNRMLLFFADLDSLKWINDTMGHEEGDKALIEAATVFKETFRTSDIIARLGGDEYAALTVDITEANSEILTARLQYLVDTRNNQENRRYRLSISVGCAYYDPENPCSIDELMVRADKLMYEQKQGKQRLLT